MTGGESIPGLKAEAMTGGESISRLKAEVGLNRL
ncbi:MAG: hypothetical protein N5P05_001610 [Chroococcopsis gigantea SAG 12.99]|nr:hypothetical protein [Chroococcopsis gigantea SAG 12.99]